MQSYAEVNATGIVRCICEFEDSFVPQISKPLLYINITEIHPQPEIGWYFNSNTGKLQPKISDNVISMYKADFNVKRSKLFTDAEWIRQRHNDRIEMKIDDSVNWNAWLNYWESLRNMPDQKDFNVVNPKWPEMPK